MRERDGDELLLRAVVQVALDPPARGVGALDDPRARRAQLDDVGAQLGVEPGVLERQRGRAADRGDELRVLVRRRARAAPPAGRRARPACDARPEPGAGGANGAPAASTQSLALGQPVGERERAVAERGGQRVAQRAGPRVAAQPRDEPGDRRGARHAAAQQPAEERERDGRERDHARPLEVLLQLGRDVEHAEDRPHGVEREHEPAAQVDGRQRPALRPRRGGPAARRARSRAARSAPRPRRGGSARAPRTGRARPRASSGFGGSPSPPVSWISMHAHQPSVATA